MPVKALAAALAGRGITRLGIAVSGGGDSVALLRAAIALRRTGGPEMFAATVHHHLRRAADEECAFVAALCAREGVAHDVLHWRWDGAGNLPDAARRARRQLLAGWARREGLGAVALGHTAEDLAETFLMRLARGAGVDGLAAMEAAFETGGALFLRPFLSQRRALLRNWLTKLGQDWRDDPTNTDPTQERARIRAALPELAAQGVTVTRLAEAAAHLAAARGALDAELARFTAEHVQQVAGALAVTGLAELHPEQQRRFLAAALRWVAGADYAPRAEALARAIEALASGAPRGLTLHGAQIFTAQGRGWVAREPRATQGGDPWDGRWKVSGVAGELRALGNALPPGWRATGLPRKVLAATPGVFEGETLIAAPLAGFGEARAEFVAARFGF